MTRQHFDPLVQEVLTDTVGGSMLRLLDSWSRCGPDDRVPGAVSWFDS